MVGTRSFHNHENHYRCGVTKTATGSSGKGAPIPGRDVWIETAGEALRERGFRSGSARSAVLRAVGAQDCVSTAQEIADRLREEGDTVGVATVYRTLEVLEQLKLVQRLDVGGSSARFEPALPDGEDHHHHFVCDRCGRITPFDDPELERVIHALEGKLGHRIDDHDVILRGSCAGCAAPA